MRQIMFHFRKIRLFLKLETPPRRFIEEAPVLQAILTVSKVTSGAVLTGVVDLEAAPEVTQTKPF